MIPSDARVQYEQAMIFWHWAIALSLTQLVPQYADEALCLVHVRRHSSLEILISDIVTQFWTRCKITDLHQMKEGNVKYTCNHFSKLWTKILWITNGYQMLQNSLIISFLSVYIFLLKSEIFKFVKRHWNGWLKWTLRSCHWLKQ